MGKASRRKKDGAPKKKRITFVDRPFEGLPFEHYLVAMREIVPAAVLTVKLKEEFGGESVQILTLLPGMAAATRKSDGVAAAGAQTIANSGDLSLDLADRLLTAVGLKVGETALSTEEPEADGPRLQDIVDPEAEWTFELKNDFAFWVGEDELAQPEVAQAIAESKEQILPTKEVEGIEGAFWIRMQREFVRWMRPEDEDTVLDALARLQNARELGFEGGRFVGVFRALGMSIPVFELDRGMEAEELSQPMKAFVPKFDVALASTEPLTPPERRARSGIISRQVTLR